MSRESWSNWLSRRARTREGRSAISALRTRAVSVPSTMSLAEPTRRAVLSGAITVSTLTRGCDSRGHPVRIARSNLWRAPTALTESEGDEHAVEVLTAFRALLREICARRGVRIAKWLGDGVMLVCVETSPLLATILELHHVVCTVSSPAQTVSIRSGITSGDVILMEGDDYIGHCVNVAARLCDPAQAGEALASPSVMDDLPRWGVAVTLRDVALRGVEKSITASSIAMPAVAEGGSLDPICGVPLSA